ncbi:unnamed protein product [Urochloa decumbens]|uniref:Uncharacterized protein n=1 Tax=Urochloa decumbens TaxID=240449 RepID=A0ABC9H0T9_9POAL
MPTPATTSSLKRPSAGGRLRRLLASLRPPARAGPLPVQTGFPTSLADLVVKNHGRLKKPARKRHHRPTPAPPPVAAAAAELTTQPPQRRELSVAPAPARRQGRVRPELLAFVGVMALALLVIWSKRLVAAATLASVALFWIESVSIRSPAARWRRMQPETAEEEADSHGRGLVSPIREAIESPAETPRPSSAASDTGSEASVSSLCAAADTADELAGDDSDSISPNKRKEKRRSLRKLFAKKLQSGKRPKEDRDSRHGGDSERPGAAGEVSVPESAVLAAPAGKTAPQPPEAVTEARCHRRRGGALPLAAFVPVVLVGLVAGKLPAVALTVLCAVFFTSVERAPDAAAQASDPR